MNEIVVKSTYLLHEGGTKFYEVISFSNGGNNRAAVVRRWGVIAKNGGGGEIKIENEVAGNSVAAAADKAVRAKNSRGYAATPFGHGFHAAGTIFTQAGLKELLYKHYNNPADRADILTALGMSGEDGGKRSDVPMPDPIVSDLPEPDRGESWASW